MPAKADKKNPSCPECGKHGVYFRKDGSIRCSKCNYEGSPEAKK